MTLIKSEEELISSSESKRSYKKVIAGIILVSLVILFMITYVFFNHNKMPLLSIVISEVLSFFHDTAWYVSEIYWGNDEYLWTSILLSVEVYLFTFTLIRLVSGEVLVESETKKKPSKYNRFLYFFILMVRRFITFINDIRETYVYVILNRQDTSKEIDLGYYYLITCLTLGVILSILIVISYEYSQLLTWSIFLACLFIIFPSIIAITKIDELDEEFKEITCISWRSSNEIVVRDGDMLLNIREGVVLLGLSIGTGIVGIVTTLGAILIKPSLIFTIIPATFDMISLITALMEFTGLKIVLKVMRDIEGLSIGLLNLLPIVSWSIYGGGVICTFLNRFRWITSVDLILTFIASVWVLIAMFSGALSGHFKYSLKSLIKRILLFIIPLLLLLIH